MKTISINISHLIDIGQENAVSMSDLANQLNADERDIRDAVMQARLNGELICGTCFGYYKPKHDLELLAYYATQAQRLRTGWKALEYTRKRLVEHGILSDDARLIKSLSGGDPE